MKTTTLKVLLSSAILVSFVLSSCNKEKDNPSNGSGYYVKFKLDGTEKQYTETTTALFTTYLPIYNCAMVGENLVNGTVYEGMAISIFNDAPIAANVTYTGVEVESIGTAQADLLFTDATGAQSSSAFLSSPDVKVTITKMNDKEITGTFSGMLESTVDFSTTHAVTEGEFHLPRPH